MARGGQGVLNLIRRAPVAVLVVVLSAEFSQPAAARDVQPVALQMGPSGSVLEVIPAGTTVPTPCSKRYKLPAAPAGAVPVMPVTKTSDSDMLCVTVAKSGLSVAFSAKLLPQDTYLPKQVDCVALRRPDADRFIVSVVAWLDDGTAVECDLTAGLLYAQNIERLSPGGAQQSAAASMTLPWTRLGLRPTSSVLNVKVCVSMAGASGANTSCLTETRETAYQSSLLVDVQNWAAEAKYAPVVRVATPQPSAGSTPGALRIHSVGGDLAVVPDVHNALYLTGVQNDASVAQQKALAQVLKFAPIAIPTPATTPVVPQSLQTRLQTAFSIPAPSSGLVTPDLKSVFDASPLSFQKIGTLNAGAAYTYGSSGTNAAAFYGIQENGTYLKAYQMTGLVAPVYARTCAAKGLKVALPTPDHRTVDDAAYMPSTASAQYSDVMSNGVLDRVAALSLDYNLYTNICDDSAQPFGERYRSFTLHVLANVIDDLNAKTAPLIGGATGATAQNVVLGESSAFTVANTSAKHFLQARETIGVQIDSPFFSPSGGSATFLAPLNGPFVNLGMTIATGDKSAGAQQVGAIDLLAYRLTNRYGDIATNESAQVVVPLGRTPITLLAGAQNGSVSDRISVLQQGLASSYYAVAFPTAAPVSPAVARNQTLQTVELTAPLWPQIQASAGKQWGTSTTCVAIKSAAGTYSCSRTTNSNFAWSLAAKISPFQAGFASTSATYPGTLSAATSTRYFGSLGANPGSITSFLSYTNCFQLSAAFTNAAYLQSSTIPQRGVTTAAQVDVPFSDFDVSLGYVNIRSGTVPAAQQSAVFALVHLTREGPQLSSLATGNERHERFLSRCAPNPSLFAAKS